jgi:hypothetical protein
MFRKPTDKVFSELGGPAKRGDGSGPNYYTMG